MLIVACGPFLVAAIVVLFGERHLISWFAGAAFGAAAALWAVIRDSPPRYVEKWLDGAHGERKTERVLKPLRQEGWVVRHEIQRPRGNYDHIAVGPSGVYLLDSKNLQGIVELDGPLPRLTRRHDPDEVHVFDGIGSNVLRCAAEVSAAVEQSTGLRVWVQAVVVFWSDFPQELVERDRCVYIHGSRLVCWLRERPSHLQPADVDRIGNNLFLNDGLLGTLSRS